MKKETLVKLFLGVGVCALLFRVGINIRAAGYLYDSKDVKYDNSKSGLASTYVDGAITELYDLAEGSLVQRIETLENQISSISSVSGVDTNNILADQVASGINTYTATEDCYVFLSAYNAAAPFAYVKLNNVVLFAMTDSSYSDGRYLQSTVALGPIVLKRGDTISCQCSNTSYSTRIKVFKIK